MTGTNDPSSIEIPASAAIREAIDRGLARMWEQQQTDGSWTTPGDIGPVSTAQVALALRYLQSIKDDRLKDVSRWLRTQQRMDGGFIGFPFADESDLGATACAATVMDLAGTPDDRAAAQRAWRVVDQLGGLNGVLQALIDRGDLSVLFLAMVGKIDPATLPAPPLALALIPPAQRFLESKFHAGILMVSFEMGILVRSLRGCWGPDGSRQGFFTRREVNAALEYIGQFQNADGSWNAYTVPTALSLAALKAAGLPLMDDRLVRGITWLEQQLIREPSGCWYPGFYTPIWSTIFNIRAAMHAGVSRSDPRMLRAVEWVLAAQSQTPQAAPNNRNPHAPRTGGWPFEPGNDTMPDCDDAGAVLTVLGMMRNESVPDPPPSSVRVQIAKSVDRGRAWLDGMQNPDGGWSSYVWGLPGKPAGPIMTRPVGFPVNNLLAMVGMLFHPPLGLGDPSTEDVTGRVLQGLGNNGFTLGDSRVQQAIRFLRNQQWTNDAFWGRWLMNFLAGTSYVLLGSLAVGVSPQEDWIRRAVAWIQGQQNSDGSWGEVAASYTDPSLAGRGPASNALTGLVLSALITAGERESESVRRGIRYLVDAQQSDGNWSNGEYVTPLILPESFYIHASASLYYPIEALAKFIGSPFAR